MLWAGGMSEPGPLTVYHLGSEQAEHSYRRHGEFAHEHDGERHEHEGGGQIHHHLPGVPPGWEPAYLEG